MEEKYFQKQVAVKELSKQVTDQVSELGLDPGRSYLIEAPELSPEQIARKIHDLKGALRTLKMFTDSLHPEFSLEGPRAEAKVDALRKIERCLNAEGEQLLSFLEHIRS